MQIIITPNDIIQRSIWDKYVKLCIYDKTEEELDKIIDDNLPFTITEEDAYAIGLLKIIETDNLIHRFNENMVDMLHIKSNAIQDELFINKSILTKEVSNYMSKFPANFKAPFNYKQSLLELKKYLEQFTVSISKLEVVSFKQKEKTFYYFRSRDIRKCLSV